MVKNVMCELQMALKESKDLKIQGVLQERFRKVAVSSLTSLFSWLLEWD